MGFGPWLESAVCVCVCVTHVCVCVTWLIRYMTWLIYYNKRQLFCVVGWRWSVTAVCDITHSSRDVTHSILWHVSSSLCCRLALIRDSKSARVCVCDVTHSTVRHVSSFLRCRLALIRDLKSARVRVCDVTHSTLRHVSSSLRFRLALVRDSSHPCVCVWRASFVMWRDSSIVWHDTFIFTLCCRLVLVRDSSHPCVCVCLCDMTPSYVTWLIHCVTWHICIKSAFSTSFAPRLRASMCVCVWHDPLVMWRDLFIAWHDTFVSTLCWRLVLVRASSLPRVCVCSMPHYIYICT